MDTDEDVPESLRPHHFLSSSLNNAVNLAEYIFQHWGDPAFKVCVRHSNLSTVSLSPAYLSAISRISFQGLKIIFFHSCWITSTTGMNRSLPVKSETLFISWTIGFYNRNTFKSTTRHMTFVVSKIRFVQGMMHLSWCSHEKMDLMLILSGMHKYLVPFSFPCIIMAWTKRWKSYGWDGLELYLATNGVLKRLAFQKLDSFQTLPAGSGFLIHHWCSVLAILSQLSLRAVPTLFFTTDLL